MLLSNVTCDDVVKQEQCMWPCVTASNKQKPVPEPNFFAQPSILSQTHHQRRNISTLVPSLLHTNQLRNYPSTTSKMSDKETSTLQSYIDKVNVPLIAASLQWY